jgi:hypothetical protein
LPVIESVRSVRLGYIAAREVPALPDQPTVTTMNQIRRALFSSICLLAASATPGLAQKTYAIGFGGGASIPVGKLSDTQSTGYNALATLAIGVADLPLGVRFDVIFNNIPQNNLSTPSGGSTAAPKSDLRVTGGLANLVFAFPGTSSKAYILAGAGYYNSKPDISGAKAQNNFGFNGGLGATFGSGPFAIFVEGRYHSVSRSASKGGVYQFVPITVGLLF